jgi:hypothetical protein
MLALSSAQKIGDDVGKNEDDDEDDDDGDAALC